MLTSSRKVRLVAALGLLTAVGMAHGARAETTRFSYVTHLTFGVTDVIPPAAHGTALGSPQVDGIFAFTPVDGTFTLDVDDFGALAGQSIYISVSQSDSVKVRRGCVPVRTAFPYAGFKPGQLVYVFIGGVGAGTCSGRATVGTVDVGL